ncbi:MAG: PilZ domain-containing protein [Magnetococcus sp. THC-1_WYH]
MKSDTESMSSHHRRSHERVLFKHDVVLELVGGKSVWGMTRNVSLRGVFLVAANVPPDVGTGNEGLLKLNISNSVKTFPCRVVYVRDNGIGIELQQKGIDFGATLTEALMQETLIRLGADINVADHLQLKLLKPSQKYQESLPKVRLIKISGNHMEFLFPALSGWSPEPGDCLNLEIRKHPYTPIAVEGVVRSVAKANAKDSMNPDDKVCSLLLPAMPKNTEGAIKALVRDLHTKRLENIAIQRASNFALHSGSDQKPKARPELRKDLERFFGNRSR